ncbi:hypothetical protein AAC387_Pa07g3174 [Persea americana]
MELKQIPPLHTLRVQRIRAAINRTHIFVHSLILLALLYYRASWLFFFLTSHSHSWTLTLTWFLLLTSELSLSFIWLLGSAYRWRPVSRAAFPERLSNDHQLPVIDVFICTADPEKEPPLHVMNTVLSAMALGYPAEKLWVYLSDDGGAAITLYAMREAFSFAKVWLPFCRKYEVRTTCPNAYFSEEDGQIRSAEFLNEREKMKSMYEAFKEQVEKAEEMGLIGDNLNKKAKQDGASLIEVIGQKGLEDHDKMPHLVYVRREKRPTHPHNFKAGALNVLLRVSGLLSNGSYILVLDCDMYSNDPTSAKAAMCFHLDPTLSPTLAFVQFSQIFHNISPNDIYGCQLRDVFKVGFFYDSVVEDIMTGIRLHCRGWNSVYYNPPRPQFLGSAPINLNDVLFQYKRWSSGLLEIAFSRYSPLPYGIMSGHSILHTMCLSYSASMPFYCVFGLCYATVPQLCLLNGISLYPKVERLLVSRELIR